MRTTIPIGIPPGTRALKLVRELAPDPERVDGFSFVRLPGRWILWIHTNDFVHGTFLRMYDDGQLERVTVRADEGDDIVIIKPKD